MSCSLKNKSGIIADYLLGQLSNDDMAKFEEHYFLCDECFNEFKTAQAAISLIEKKGPEILKITDPWWAVLWHKLKKKWDDLLDVIRSIPRAQKYVLAPVVILLLANFITYPIYYTDQVPDKSITIPKYSSKAMRGLEISERDQRENQILHSKFTTAISYYQNQNYTTAIALFNDFEKSINIAEKVPLNEKVNIERELFFFRGMSFYLQFATIKPDYWTWIKRNMAKETRVGFADEAIDNLRTSVRLANKNNLQQVDRDMYYLGRALAKSGQKDLALIELGKIDKQSSFFQKSEQLINELKNK